MKKIIFLLVAFIFAGSVYAQNTVEGKISTLSMQSMTAKLNTPYTTSSLKNKPIKIIKKFNLSETFGSKVSGQGTMELGEGIITAHQGAIVIVKVTKYYSTKVENGVTKPLANVGNIVVLKWE